MYTIGYVESLKGIIIPVPKNKYQINCDLKVMPNNFTLEHLLEVDGVILDEREPSEFHAICKKILYLKKNSDMFIWLISKSDLSIAGQFYLSIGIDGIFKKSHTREEILLHIQNALDRFKNYKLKEQAEEMQSKRSDDLKLIIKKENLSCALQAKMGGEEFNEVYLTKIEFKILDYLNGNRGVACSYEDIYKVVWKRDTGNKEDMQIRLSNCIFQIRKKLEQHQIDSKLIKTVRTVGYMIK